MIRNWEADITENEKAINSLQEVTSKVKKQYDQKSEKLDKAEQDIKQLREKISPQKTKNENRKNNGKT